MLKRNIVCFCLMVCVAAFSGLASANPPYASILAYTHGQNMQPTMNMLAVLNIINLTPWEIYIGDPTNKTDIMNDVVIEFILRFYAQTTVYNSVME